MHRYVILKIGEIMIWKKIRFYIKLHWLKALLFIFLAALTISLVILVVIGLRAWNESESYLRQSQ